MTEFESINPTTNELIERIPATPPREVRHRLEKAMVAFSMWEGLPASVRADTLTALAKVLRAKEGPLARQMAMEMGKPVTQGREEVEKSARACDYYAENGPRYLAEERVATQARTSFVRLRPLGIVLGIMPWNFPLWQVIRYAVPAVLAGNVTVLKHSSCVPRFALTIEELFLQAGFPPGVFQSILIGNAETSRLIADPRIRGVSLTGSVAAGKQVGRVAGRWIKKAVLELGGSDPFIILDDADVSQVAQAAVEGRVANSGQSCISAKRFIVASSIAKPFLREFRRRMAGLKVGDPLEESTQVGPLARTDLVDSLESQVKRTLKAGAILELGGERLARSGNFYGPTILSNVRPGMAAFDEETFGPVAAVTISGSDDESIRLANHSTFGLGASLWTRNEQRALRLLDRIHSGMVFVNSIVVSDPRLPFGGIKDSGVGRELGWWGIREFVNTKTIWIGQ